ncbi:MAG: response regulator [Candidatus Eisenbacteria bacterium]|uniref:Response regulator transcription factor n=1 Tax=Eiseniibacteriota bacterium TaxID=2212470 RepID=A0A956RQP2_UNCEI|nr:response regulator transcription factor [Candidatus Eisenbacteria bacterium]
MEHALELFDFDSQTIALVEDDPIQAKVLQKRLIETGYSVTWFASARELIDSLETEEAPSAILCDINLPEVSGLELMKRIQSHPAWCLVPSVLMTSDPTRDHLWDARKLPVPVEGFLVKPVVPQALDTMFQNLLKKQNPTYLLRHFQRQRVSLELRARTRDRELNQQAQEVSRALEETAKQRGSLESELLMARNALEGSVGAREKAEMTAALTELHDEEVVLRDRLRELQERRGALITQKKKLLAEIDRELRILDVQIRTAEEVVRNSMN